MLRFRKCLLILAFLFPAPSSFAADDCVILLHGLMRNSNSMIKLQKVLEKHHYKVINVSYPSTQKSVEDLAKENLPPLINACLADKPRKLHFVTHSLGGIILKRYLEQNSLPQLGSVVMLAPPNHGSRFVDILNNKLSRFLIGPAFSELGTHKSEAPLKPGNYKIGVIAGNYTLNPLNYLIFKGPNDGKVAVASTKTRFMSDFIVLPVGHTYIMSNGSVIKEILYFLEKGKFLHLG